MGARSAHLGQRAQQLPMDFPLQAEETHRMGITLWRPKDDLGEQSGGKGP